MYNHFSLWSSSRWEAQSGPRLSLSLSSLCPFLLFLLALLLGQSVPLPLQLVLLLLPLRLIPKRVSLQSSGMEDVFHVGVSGQSCIRTEVHGGGAQVILICFILLTGQVIFLHFTIFAIIL